MKTNNEQCYINTSTHTCCVREEKGNLAKSLMTWQKCAVGEMDLNGKLN
jgi:hypothetical protein